MRNEGDEQNGKFSCEMRDRAELGRRQKVRADFVGLLKGRDWSMLKSQLKAGRRKSRVTEGHSSVWVFELPPGINMQPFS